ncbi:MAG: methionyl-tRNA synthetase [Chloroflexi bacterium OLB15]|nr:MAG: methionyl-tRNA synthetase [Chloroflexi bacterium OLB15]
MSKYIHVSVAWPYSNGDLHVGHLAGAYLPADIFARYHRLKGDQVLMVSGSDAHGTPISVEADKRGVSPVEIFTKYHERFLLTQQKIGISYNLFTHTDTENHHQIAQEIFTLLLEHGFLYLETQALLYSEKERRFLPDRYVEGECYICHYPNARGDQCDNCGNLLDATQLINPRSKNDPTDQLVVRESEHYFLDLSKFSSQLLKYLDKHEDHWRPNVVRFSRNFISEGLRGRPITRDIDWGIPVPLEGWESKRLYVWFDAVMGYLTASIEWAKHTGQPDAWKNWWYNADAEIYNFIGKDNIPFHTIIWPAELLGIDGIYNDATGISLPYDVPANEFMNIEGAQFSKSRNWAIWLPDILDRYQPDAIRYYVAATFPETHDSDFAWDGFFNRVNGELLAAWGNLVNRMLSFAYKRFDGKVPSFDSLTDADKAMIARSEAAFEEVGSLIEKVRLREALQTAMGIVREANGYLDGRKPWQTIKDDPADAARAVYAILRVIDNLNLVLSPFLPFSAQAVHEYLGYDGQLFGTQHIETYAEASRSHNALVYNGSAAIGKWKKRALAQGQALREPKALYTKLDPEIIEQERAYLGAERIEHEIFV